MAYVRLFQSAVDPADVAEVQRLFSEDVRPAFGAVDGCLSIELMINVDKNAGGLVEGCAVSRWASLDQLDAALRTRPVQEALVRIRQLLRQEPVSKTYEVLT
jgi:quinol monooxygenase YgiN